jgi:3-carboxy-cis,cis-muconate cycloisomerase
LETETDHAEIFRAMTLFDNLFSYDALQQLLSDEARIRGLLRFEAALAKAEARAGVIPEGSARKIAEHCEKLNFNVGAIAKNAALAGNIAIPLVKLLTEAVSQQDKDAARFVHWGATSQDAIDTGFLLQAREVLALLEQDLVQLTGSLAALAEQHRLTPAVARTWMQHAAPTTFGCIVAGWLDSVLRHRTRLAEIRSRLFTLQFGGAVGTLAAFKERGPEVAKALTAELQLTLPSIPWHTHRDRMGELATFLGLLSGTIGKIARDISLRTQTEVGELAEPAADGRGGSSTMPQKRNPVTCAVLLSAAARVPGLVATILAATPQEYERGLGSWPAEWETLPELLRVSAGALHHLVEMLPGLQVDPERMRQNIDASQGSIFAEAVGFALADRMGKMPAHMLVESASKKAIATKRLLKDVLLEEPNLHGHLTPADLEGLFEVRNYLGSADQFVQSVLEAARAFPLPA